VCIYIKLGEGRQGTQRRTKRRSSWIDSAAASTAPEDVAAPAGVLVGPGRRAVARAEGLVADAVAAVRGLVFYLLVPGRQ
jgi:hypothetical protein